MDIKTWMHDKMGSIAETVKFTGWKTIAHGGDSFDAYYSPTPFSSESFSLEHNGIKLWLYNGTVSMEVEDVQRYGSGGMPLLVDISEWMEDIDEIFAGARDTVYGKDHDDCDSDHCGHSQTPDR